MEYGKLTEMLSKSLQTRLFTFCHNAGVSNELPVLHDIRFLFFESSIVRLQFALPPAPKVTLI